MDSSDPTSSSSGNRVLIPSSTFTRLAFPKSISHWFPISDTDPSSTSQPYVTCLLSLSSTNLLSSSDSETHPLRIYNKSSISNSFSPNDAQQNQPFHSVNWSMQPAARVTSITESPLQPEQEKDSNHFIATTSSGLLAHFDLRSNNGPASVMTVPGGKTPYLTSAPSFAGNLVAAGRELEQNEACVDLWDIRQSSKPIMTFTESHSDDITSLRFLSPFQTHSSSSSHLLTSSTDGLISIIDTSLGEDEDDSVLSVGNLGASVAKSGWNSYKSQESKSSVNSGGMDIDQTQDDQDTPKLALPDVWAISDMQTLATFNTDGFDPILSPVDARGPACLQPPWSTDYIIDAFDSRSLAMDQQDGLKLFCGDQNGSFSIISVSSKDSDANPTPWRLEALFPSGMNGGHCDIVRCVNWDRGSRTLFTGGEDGRICTWDLSSGSSINSNENQTLSSLPTANAVNDDSEFTTNGGKDRNGSGLKKDKRFKPYG